MNKASRSKFALFGPIALAMIILILLAPSISANGFAVIIEPDYCLMFNLDGVQTEIAENGRILVTRNTDLVDDSRWQLKCETTFNNPDGKAINWDFDSTGNDQCDGFLKVVRDDGTIETLYYFTTKWHQVISSSGKSTLICNFDRGPTDIAQ